MEGRESSCLSDVTRAKVARELVLSGIPQAPGIGANHSQPRRRVGPCLRKLVLWTNLLDASTSLSPYPSDPIAPPIRPISSSSQEPESLEQLNRIDQDWDEATPTQEDDPSPEQQAEHDWFENLMDEIDDSDVDDDESEFEASESESESEFAQTTSQELEQIIQSAQNSTTLDQLRSSEEHEEEQVDQTGEDDEDYFGSLLSINLPFSQDDWIDLRQETQAKHRPSRPGRDRCHHPQKSTMSMAPKRKRPVEEEELSDCSPTPPPWIRNRSQKLSKSSNRARHLQRRTRKSRAKRLVGEWKAKSISSGPIESEESQTEEGQPDESLDPCSSILNFERFEACGGEEEIEVSKENKDGSKMIGAFESNSKHPHGGDQSEVESSIMLGSSVNASTTSLSIKRSYRFEPLVNDVGIKFENRYEDEKIDFKLYQYLICFEDMKKYEKNYYLIGFLNQTRFNENRHCREMSSFDHEEETDNNDRKSLDRLNKRGILIKTKKKKLIESLNSFYPHDGNENDRNLIFHCRVFDF